MSMPACATKNGRSSPEACETAEANLLLAEQEDARAVALAARDFASKQKLDESNASLAKARADLDLKRAQLAAARAGPTAEERALADARVVLAEATVADLQAKLDKTRLVAPVDGVVGILVAEPGEVVPVGKPVLTLDVGNERWFSFTLREDALGRLDGRLDRHAGDRRWPEDSGACHGAPAARRVRHLACRARRRRP